MSDPKRILCPPRPRGKLDPLRELNKFDKSGNWLAQRKFNGIRTLIWVGPDGDMRLYDRYLKSHVFDLTSQRASSILDSLNLEEGKEYWLDGEHLHAKTTSVKDTFVLYDVLWAGKFLFGKTQVERLDLLSDLCGNPQFLEPGDRALEVGPGLWMADVFYSNFMDRYKEYLDEDWCEGLVLRKKKSKLDTPCRSVDEEVTWQKRCRKSSKLYTH